MTASNNLPLIKYKDGKTISIVFLFPVPEFLGNVVVIHTMAYMAKHFNTILYTNQADFIKKKIPNARVVSLPPLPGKRTPFVRWFNYWRRIAKVVRRDNPDAVMTGQTTAPIALWVGKPCFQYIYQVHEVIGFGMGSNLFYRKILQKCQVQ